MRRSIGTATQFVKGKTHLPPDKRTAAWKKRVDDFRRNRAVNARPGNSSYIKFPGTPHIGPNG